MPAIDILFDKWQILLALFSAWAFGVVVAQTLYMVNSTFAFKLVDWLDVQRKIPIRYFHNLLKTPWGVLKSAGFIFLVNLLGAGFFQHSILGVLIFPSFVFLFVGGLLVSLLLFWLPTCTGSLACLSGLVGLSASGGQESCIQRRALIGILLGLTPICLATAWLGWTLSLR